MSDQIVNSEDLRSIILNADKIKKDHQCNICKGTGYMNWNNETGNDMRFGRLTTYVDDRDDGECEDCLGIGFVDIFQYSE